ncbi:MAG: hypothetical protein H6724_08815 [Sandaracinus sp.]|nr:hypothetical protein [Sandaracinus sp.]MCB9619535.1 hypothetical protein [Sandaracinus sp.]
MHAPELPDVARDPERTQEGRVRLRYEDLAQDGRMKADVVPFAMSEICWRQLLVRHAMTARLQAEGILPILRRLIVAADETPLSTMAEPEVTGSFGLALARAKGGDRFLLELTAELRGPRGRTFAKVERAGEVERVARVYGEHVFTRLFAPPEERRVRALPEGLAVQAERPWVEPEDLLRADEGLVDGEPVRRAMRFSLVHTDSNQHVNSLAYPRLFEEVALDAWGEPWLGRGFDVAYRKPCFAGDEVVIFAQRVRRGETRGARVWLEVEGETRPRCAARLWFR